MIYGPEKRFLSHLTLNCELDLVPSHIVLVHHILFHEGECLCPFVLHFCNWWRIYGLDKLLFLHLIWLWTVNVNLNLVLAIQFLCSLHTLSWWWTLVSSYIKFLQLMKELWTRQAVYHIWPWTVKFTLNLATQFLLTAPRPMICVKLY